MSSVFWFFLGSFITAGLWFVAVWFEEWRENRRRLKEAEEMVIKLWFGDDRE